MIPTEGFGKIPDNNLERARVFAKDRYVAAKNNYIVARDVYIQLTAFRAEEIGVDPTEIYGVDGISDLGVSEITIDEAEKEERVYKHQLPYGTLELNAEVRLATTPLPEKHEVKLTRRENLVLERLIENPEGIHTYSSLNRLGAQKRNTHTVRSSSALRNVIGDLRSKLGETRQTPLIYSARGIGYSLTRNAEYVIS